MLNVECSQTLSNFEGHAPRIAQGRKEVGLPWDRIDLGTRAFPGDGGQLNLLKSMKRQFASVPRVRLA